MHQRTYQVIVLRPTASFLSYLSTQLPESELPDLDLLTTDSTSYAIPATKSDDDLLEVLELFYPTMFRHEIYRWLGDKVARQFDLSFFDFLCCFKFEIHSHIVMMEASMQQAHQALIIKPKTVLLNWVQTPSYNKDAGVGYCDKIALSNLADTATVMVKNFTKLSEIKPFIERNYSPIFDLFIARMGKYKSEWPQVDSFHAFKQYFTIHIHTQLISLEALAMAA